ncbi:PfaD family polyunsaturated fatty acid/polyketide biosynthesis protein [Gynuella sunshinyii]|uniref:Dioxygenase n=1 Tax=Gynuella sunshinyii YC6258 TaxID=1445510 RepID=A0A0C5VQV7_9GAMM|nr:PfaD family polyunsaturated fatty acid/polyketide biosynthesis protein [Gynuella sunshinyii]AJQ95768.1 dioxygenases-like 2-nitropropane dioxygenase [Gynuella sunshinyii YC6258]DAC80069.1 TPA_exp: dioxygenase [Gynuella sunshinyii YC6258]
MNSRGRFIHLGSKEFLREYRVRHPYVAGAMYKGIASAELVIAMASQGMLSFLGTGGMKFDEVERSIVNIKQAAGADKPFGMNMLSNFEEPEKETALIQLYLKHGISVIEAASYISISEALVYYRVAGLTAGPDGKPLCRNRIIAKVSRPEVAARFLSPPPDDKVASLLQQGLITPAQAQLAPQVPMADDICVESDSGGHTDQGVMTVLFPAIRLLADEYNRRFEYPRPVRVGAAGGLGTPHALAAAFMLGADFVVTGSINQCTVEAGISEDVKNMLEKAQPQDMAIVPAGDMFELGAKVQVLKKGTLFHVRANKLYELYRNYDAIDSIPADVISKLEEQIFARKISDIWAETEAFYRRHRPQEITKAASSPKHKMALIFKWYFVHGTRMALRGEQSQRVNYQVQSGPALGAFNQWVKGTALESWRNRHVVDIAHKLMQGAQDHVNQFLLTEV